MPKVRVDCVDTSIALLQVAPSKCSPRPAMSDRRIARDLLIYVLNWVRAVFYMMVGVPRNTSRLPENFFARVPGPRAQGLILREFAGQWACGAARGGSDVRRGRGGAWNDCLPRRIAHRRQVLEQTRAGCASPRAEKSPLGPILVSNHVQNETTPWSAAEASDGRS